MLFTRRAALRVGSAALGLTLPGLLQNQALGSSATKSSKPAKAKSVIILYLSGGPSQLDMWDLKPEAPQEIRGTFRPIDTRVPGVSISEHLPRMAKLTDKLAIVRSMSHTENDHVKAAYWTMTGRKVTRQVVQASTLSRADWPHMGGVVAQQLQKAGETSGLPPFVMTPEWISPVGPSRPGQHAGFLGAKFDPYVALPSLQSRFVDSFHAAPERLRQRQALLDFDPLWSQHESMRQHDESFAKAMNLLSSPQTLGAFDLAQESPKTLERYGATHSFGRSALLARRLVEAGARLVQVNFVRHDKGEGGQGYDSHCSPPYPSHLTWCKDVLFPPTDAAFSSLVEDLHDRGLLDETLVIMMGEFGRTPRFNSHGGRDHWAKCYSLVMAGGGVKPGIVHGASDKIGAYPVDDPVSIADLFATVYHLLGIDPDAIIHDLQDRPLAIAEGTPVRKLLI